MKNKVCGAHLNPGKVVKHLKVVHGAQALGEVRRCRGCREEVPAERLQEHVRCWEEERKKVQENRESQNSKVKQNNKTIGKKKVTGKMNNRDQEREIKNPMYQNPMYQNHMYQNSSPPPFGRAFLPLPPGGWGSYPPNPPHSYYSGSY